MAYVENRREIDMENKKILFCRWNIVGEVDVIDAIRECGYHIDICEEFPQSVDYDVDYMKKLSDILFKGEYHYVFSMNFIPLVSRVCQIFKLPYVSWSVDCPEFMLFSKTLSNSCNYIFLFDKDMVQKFSKRNPGHVFYMPLGTNTKRWDKITVSAEERKKYQSEVSFIGSLYTEKSKYRSYEMEKELPDYLRGFCNGLVEAQLKVYGYNFLDDVVTEAMAQEFKKYAGWNDVFEDYEDVTKETVANDFLGLRCTELERIRLLQSVAENFSLDLYTLSDKSFVPSANYCGVVSYENEMPKVFQCSKINLNFTSKSIKTGVPLRIFDIIGAGGFLLSNYQQELPDYFVIGEDLDVYENEQDLLEKIRYYLSHEEERRQIALNGQNKVRKYYTWKQRVEDILTIMEQVR